MSLGQVLGPDRRRQSIVRIVGHGDGFVLFVERLHVDARAEDLFLDRRIGFLEAGPDRRLNPPAPVIVPADAGHAAAGMHLGAVRLRLLIIAQHLLAMLLGDQRARSGFGAHGIAEDGFAGALREALDELLENRTLHIEAFGVETYLTAIGEHRPHGAGHRLVEIGIGEHHTGILAAQFH